VTSTLGREPDVVARGWAGGLVAAIPIGASAGRLPAIARRGSHRPKRRERCSEARLVTPVRFQSNSPSGAGSARDDRREGHSRHFFDRRTGCDRLRPASTRHSLCGMCVVVMVPSSTTANAIDHLTSRPPHRRASTGSSLSSIKLGCRSQRCAALACPEAPHAGKARCSEHARPHRRAHIHSLRPAYAGQDGLRPTTAGCHRLQPSWCVVAV
jgi:hypothetical protein